MTIDRSVKMEGIIPFNITRIFDGGTLEEVTEKLYSEYSKLQSYIDDGKFITFGIDASNHDVYVKIWRIETELEYERRVARIERLAHARTLIGKNKSDK